MRNVLAGLALLAAMWLGLGQRDAAEGCFFAADSTVTLKAWCGTNPDGTPIPCPPVGGGGGGATTQGGGCVDPNGRPVPCGP
jgi:hypothetical protein